MKKMLIAIMAGVLACGSGFAQTNFGKSAMYDSRTYQFLEPKLIASNGIATVAGGVSNAQYAGVAGTASNLVGLSAADTNRWNSGYTAGTNAQQRVSVVETGKVGWASFNSTSNKADVAYTAVTGTNFSTQSLTLGVTNYAAWGTNWVDLGNASWAVRQRPGFSEMNGQMWVYGGMGNAGIPAQDTWYSTNGVLWTQSSAAGLNNIMWPACCSYNNKLWVVAGENFGGYNPEVWSTPDGTNWTQLTTAAAFPKRTGASVVSFKGQLWLTGGRNSGIATVYNDIWHSTDGITWTQTVGGTPFTTRYNHGSVVFDNKIWVIGGMTHNDIWSSPDGTNWTMAAAAPWTYAEFASPVVIDGKLFVYVMEGTCEVWTSAAGSSWSLLKIISENAPPGLGSSMLAYNNKLWLAGGLYSGTYYQRVFRSDGVNTDYRVMLGTSTSRELVVNASIIPSASNQYSLGSAAYPFGDLYLDTNSVYMGGQRVLRYDPARTNLIAVVPVIQQTSPTNTNTVAYVSVTGTPTNGQVIAWNAAGSQWNPTNQTGGGGGGSISFVSPPTATNSAGTPGQLAYNGSYFYVCVTNNSWKRAILAGW